MCKKFKEGGWPQIPPNYPYDMPYKEEYWRNPCVGDTSTKDTNESFSATINTKPIFASDQLSVYVSHPITGLPWDVVKHRLSSIADELRSAGLKVFLPILLKEAAIPGQPVGKDNHTYIRLRSDKIALSMKYHMRRDFWMISQSDILFAIIEDGFTSDISIGCICELAWAYNQRKHIVAVITDDKHMHPFIDEMIDVRFDNLATGIEYLRELSFGIM